VDSDGKYVPIEVEQDYGVASGTTIRFKDLWPTETDHVACNVLYTLTAEDASVQDALTLYPEMFGKAFPRQMALVGIDTSKTPNVQPGRYKVTLGATTVGTGPNTQVAQTVTQEALVILLADPECEDDKVTYAVSTATLKAVGTGVEVALNTVQTRTIAFSSVPEKCAQWLTYEHSIDEAEWA